MEDRAPVVVNENQEGGHGNRRDVPTGRRGGDRGRQTVLETDAFSILERRSATSRVDTLESLRKSAAAAAAPAAAELLTQMVTTADTVTFEQQLRQEITQQLGAEMSETAHGRIDMLSSINTALQNVSAKPAASKPFRTIDVIPRNWEGRNVKGTFRHFMSRTCECNRG